MDVRGYAGFTQCLDLKEACFDPVWVGQCQLSFPPSLLARREP